MFGTPSSGADGAAASDLAVATKIAVLSDAAFGFSEEGGMVWRDIDGRPHAVGSGSVAAICETDDGVLILLPDGRVIHLPKSMAVLLDWMDGRR